MEPSKYLHYQKNKGAKKSATSRFLKRMKHSDISCPKDQEYQQEKKITKEKQLLVNNHDLAKALAKSQMKERQSRDECLGFKEKVLNLVEKLRCLKEEQESHLSTVLCEHQRNIMESLFNATTALAELTNVCMKYDPSKITSDEVMSNKRSCVLEDSSGHAPQSCPTSSLKKFTIYNDENESFNGKSEDIVSNKRKSGDKWKRVNSSDENEKEEKEMDGKDICTGENVCPSIDKHEQEEKKNVNQTKAFVLDKEDSITGKMKREQRKRANLECNKEGMSMNVSKCAKNFPNLNSDDCESTKRRNSTAKHNKIHGRKMKQATKNTTNTRKRRTRMDEDCDKENIMPNSEQFGEVMDEEKKPEVLRCSFENVKRIVLSPLQKLQTRSPVFIRRNKRKISYMEPSTRSKLRRGDPFTDVTLYSSPGVGLKDKRYVSNRRRNGVNRARQTLTKIENLITEE